MIGVVVFMMRAVVRLLGAVTVVISSTQLASEVASFVRIVHFLEIPAFFKQSLFVQVATIFSVVVMIEDFWGVVLHDSLMR